MSRPAFRYRLAAPIAVGEIAIDALQQETVSLERIALHDAATDAEIRTLTEQDYARVAGVRDKIHVAKALVDAVAARPGYLVAHLGLRTGADEQRVRIALTLIGAVATIAAAVLAIVLSNRNDELATFRAIADGHGCKEAAATKSACLETVVQKLAADVDALDAQLSDGFQCSQDLQAYRAITYELNLGCSNAKTGDALLECLAALHTDFQVLRRFADQASRGTAFTPHCPLDKDQFACVKRALAAPVAQPTVISQTSRGTP